MKILQKKKSLVLFALFFSVLFIDIADSSAQKQITFSPTEITGLKNACLTNLPSPTLLAEPLYTKGSSNRICFKLPLLEELPVSLDSVLSAFIITEVSNSSSGGVFELPLPVTYNENKLFFEVATGLADGVRYDFSSALFLQKCLVACQAVVDTSQLELLCSPFTTAVSSIQDITEPEVRDVQITGNVMYNGWSNLSGFSVSGNLNDPAGVWKGLLYRRACGDPEWLQVVVDTTFTGILSNRGYVYADTTSAVFEQRLSDGCYQYRLVGKDAAHTPESCEGQFALAGNGGVASDTLAPQIQIRIDTTPPAPVELTCSQFLNSIRLQWSVGNDVNAGIGLAGYWILRDSDTLATVDASVTEMVDEIPAEIGNRTFVYQAQPFDSLGNTQRVGGQSVCSYRAVSLIAMAPEPEYTKGHGNTVSWRTLSDIDTFTVFLAKGNDFPTATSFQVIDTTATFNNLSDGISYSYWVIGSDANGRIIASDTVSSFQDATVPQIQTFGAPDKIELDSGSWISNRNILLQVNLQDLAPGQLNKIEVRENGQNKFGLILPATSSLDTLISYPVQAESCLPFQLELRAIDMAGNVSSPAYFSLRLDDIPPKPTPELVCSQLQKTSGIELVWRQSEDNGFGCSGLSGYRIFRDGVQLTEVTPNILEYKDIFSSNQPGGHFNYQVQPFDSVGNVQVEGGSAGCDYVAGSAINVVQMPEFTKGLESTICWDVSGSLEAVTVYLDADCNSAVDDSARYFQSQTKCHTFRNLEDGKEYCYWLTGIDEQRRNVQSEIMRSQQDNSSPVIQRFELPDVELAHDQAWVYSTDLSLNIMASDPGGEIWAYKVAQQGVWSEPFSFQDSSMSINVNVHYEIISPGTKPEKIEISLLVIDGAGNESAPLSEELFFQTALPEIYAYPNPFSPPGDKITIRVANTDENELNIYDFFGNLVRRLSEKNNRHDFVWDGKNGLGEVVANGGYICVGKSTGSQFKIGVLKQ